MARATRGVDTGLVSYDAAREDLVAWRTSYPANPFDADHSLREGLAHYVLPPRLSRLEHRARDFAAHVVDVVAPAALRYEQRAHLPELARYDGIGQRLEEVSFDPSYHVAGDAVWSSGLIGLSGQSGSAFEQMVLLYLLSAEGEAGHACPATCTIGLARALRRRGDLEVRERFLPALLDVDYARAERGAQFLTEVQGGSDVGANACVAESIGDGTYRISGEKWFCSVADADQFFVTARLAGAGPGTRGLGSFVVPRVLDGAPNGFSLRRLKDKLGTRGLASGEIDFDGARAWPVGPLEEGFRTAVSVVLNTSRWMTAVGSAGIMRRALVEAAGFAQHRRAFGQLIGQFPSLQRTLADMAALTQGALGLVLALTDLEDRLDAGGANDQDLYVHRFLVNATKLVVSSQASVVVRQGIEVLGGNGTIEEFSVLPRLYRDAIVYESWEGTHNVLAAQVLNDLRRLPLLDAVAAHIAEPMAKAPFAAQVEEQMDALARCVEDTAYAAWHFRAHLERLGVLLEALYAPGPAAEHLVASVTPGYDAAHDPGFAERVTALIAGF